MLSPLQEERIRFLICVLQLKSKIENGFTILEILCTIAILSIVMIPLMKMLPDAMVLDAQMERETRVAFLAQQKIEEVKNKAIYDFSQDYSESATAFPSPDSDFKYTVSDDQGTAIKEIEVVVWYDKDGNGSVDADEEDIELNTKIAER
jgi:prepilin-type N-terminal cleavage/methylation domain-containing protein